MQARYQATLQPEQENGQQAGWPQLTQAVFFAVNLRRALSSIRHEPLRLGRDRARFQMGEGLFECRCNGEKV
jgi:hypothetical protein